jgi:outer membrane protein
MGSAVFAAEPFTIVNFTTCVLESKYGKYEQEQLETKRKQYSTTLEETDKKLKETTSKLEDQEYMDNLSPEAEESLKLEHKTYSEDMNRLQSQFYQDMQQSQYILMQKIAAIINKASEKIAKEKQFGMIINKDACFYYKPDLDITSSVIVEMDKIFDDDMKKIKATKAAAEKTAAKTADTKPIASTVSPTKKVEEKAITQPVKATDTPKKDEEPKKDAKDAAGVKK